GDCPLFFVYLTVLQLGQARLVESNWFPHARQKTIPDTGAVEAAASTCADPPRPSFLLASAPFVLNNTITITSVMRLTSKLATSSTITRDVSPNMVY
ncbi:hypothetical protein ABES03_22800, partial [Neobacillus rhizosphaerae]|uniref:hypothetical protein n=1 Tax=Neobacillus rhizosphaerae TaxID=2880965 RepID=UPI003D27BC51